MKRGKPGIRPSAHRGKEGAGRAGRLGQSHPPCDRRLFTSIFAAGGRRLPPLPMPAKNQQVVRSSPLMPFGTWYDRVISFMSPARP